MTSSFIAVICVDLTQLSKCSMRTGTLKTIHLVMADSSILTRVVWLAVVNVVLTVQALETWSTGAGICPYVVIASGAILAWL